MNLRNAPELGYWLIRTRAQRPAPAVVAVIVSLADHPQLSASERDHVARSRVRNHCLERATLGERLPRRKVYPGRLLWIDADWCILARLAGTPVVVKPRR